MNPTNISVSILIREFFHPTQEPTPSYYPILDSVYVCPAAAAMVAAIALVNWNPKKKPVPTTDESDQP